MELLKLLIVEGSYNSQRFSMKKTTIFLLTLIMLSNLHFQMTQSQELTQDQDLVTITFDVEVPSAQDSLDLQEILFLDSYTYDSHTMTKISTTEFEYSIELTPGTIFKYRYGIDNQWETLNQDNKQANNYYRVLHVPAQDTTISEKVVGYIDSSPATGTAFVNVTGQIVDSTTGRGLENGEIWIGGVRGKIGRNGSFYIDSTVAGMQRVTVLPETHHYKTVMVDLSTSGDPSVNFIKINPIAVDPAKIISVTFLVKVPHFPATNQLRLIGDKPFLGYDNHFGYNLHSPVLQHLKDNWYTTTVEMHAGTAITYQYTFGAAWINIEWDNQFHRNYRKAVFYEDSVVRDKVFSWTDDPNTFDSVELTVNVPSTTPPNEAVYLHYGLTLIPMQQSGSLSWTTILWLPPWEQELKYSYQLGTFTAVYNEFNYDATHNRVVADSVGQVTDTVEGWRWIANATDPSIDSVNITIGVNVPYYTPDSDTLYLIGDGIGWSNPMTKQLTRIENHYFETQLLLDRGVTYDFSVTRGDFSSQATSNFTISGNYNGQLVHGHIDGWKDLNGNWNRTSMIGGVMLMDWWDPQMKSLVAPAFERFSNEGGQWIEYAPQWSVDHRSPTPYIGAEGGSTEEELTYIVEQAHRYDLKVYLSVGINGEVAADFTGVGWPDYTNEQWQIYRQAFLDIADYSSRIAQSLGIELLALPNYIGPNVTAFDALMNESIDLVRSQYTGQLTTSLGWTNTEYTFPAKLDYVGMYFWDNFLDGNNQPTTQQLVDAIGQDLDTRYKPFADRFNKPILFGQIAYAAVPGSNYRRDLQLGFNTIQSENYSQKVQARVYEAFFQAIANRTWVAGGFSFGYFYFQLDYPDYSIAYKQAEAVVLKWTHMFGDKNYIEPVAKYRVQNNFQLPYNSQYNEIRYSLGDNASWSNWMATSETLDLANVVTTSIHGGGEYMVWLQGRSGADTSIPISVLLQVDTAPPVLTVDRTDGIRIHVADDTSTTITIQFNERYQQVLNFSSETKQVFLPSEILAGNYNVSITAMDALGQISTEQLIIQVPISSISTSSSKQPGENSGGFLPYPILSSIIMIAMLTIFKKRINKQY